MRKTAVPELRLAEAKTLRRLAAVDWLLIGISLPILLFGVIMSVVHGVRGDFVRGALWITSAPNGQSYPVVSGLNYPCPFAVGDRVLRLEGNDLRGQSGAGYVLRWSVAAQASHSLLYKIDRSGVRSELRETLVPGAGFPVPASRWWLLLPYVFAGVGTGALVLVRAAHWPLARRVYVCCVLWGLLNTPYFHDPTAPRAGFVMSLLVVALAFGLTIWTVFEFVPGARLSQLWRAVLLAPGLLWSAATAASLWLPDEGPAAVMMRAFGVADLGFVTAVLVALTQGYRRSAPLGRRQIKWVVYGFYVATLPQAVWAAVDSLAWATGSTRLFQWHDTLFVLADVAAVAVPLGFLVAIAFYQFLDIDRLFSATLSYSALAVLGIAGVLWVMPTASRAASDAFGLDPATAQFLVALGLAAVAVLTHRLVRPRIERLFFPEHLALSQGFDRLLTEVASCTDARKLTALVGQQLDVLLRPISAAVYALAGDIFTPVAVRGRTAPPAFAARSALIGALQERTAPLVAERWTKRRATCLTPFERAALETLDVAVLLPIRRGPDLVAFTCLGPKRSGDIYTPTDLALLGAVARAISDRLLALDATAVAEQARVMQEALRRYVPGAVAERIVTGRDIEAAECEVTVLFVDIRGYTGYSEPREAEEVFRTVNRYTETVSRLVQARGGVVVEFHGDGMLAVFGAPDEISMKELAAVQAGRDIVMGIARLAGLGGEAATALSVGVGIATGPAFVGNIQSADRLIWTVVGNTVNLAARLQSMTRELDAAVAVDDTTFRRAGPACADFALHSGLAIRGRRQAETVHALPLR